MTIQRYYICPALAAACILLAIIIMACDGEQTFTLPPELGRAATLPAASPLVPATLTSSATIALPSAQAGVQPTPRPSPAAGLPPGETPVPLPTPHPGNAAWIRERLDAVVSLYRPTAAGEALLRSLDFRQMRGEPGFFGSYGFDGWAGVGEAKPIGVMHELSHSYWGGFPVIGRPELSWERGEGDEVAPALASYHRDILAFMAQPPDEYEFLRERLRNLPKISSENTEPLFHSLETDVVYMTGGDLSLVPPALRKYWGLFLSDGPFGSWERAMGWYQSLPPEDRATAGKFLGFEHLDLRQYPDLPTFSPPGGLLTAAADTLAVEERQRLTDLAEHFDLLLGDAQLEENFQFWRGYLQDKVTLYRSHPGHLQSLGLPRPATCRMPLNSFPSWRAARKAGLRRWPSGYPFSRS